jgi:transcription-repair coupling factor (superfamily II helicase)
MLGAGFQIALRDLEIRGAGNLLGAEQSGHIAAVGYEMYCQLLEQAVLDLKSGKKPPAFETMIDIGVTGKIPEQYIASASRRLAMYRRFGACEDESSVLRVVEDLRTGYGDLPESIFKLVMYHELRVAASAMGISSMTIDEQDIIIRTKDSSALNKRLHGTKGTLRPVGVPSSSGFVVVYYRPEERGDLAGILAYLHAKIVQSSSL